MSGEMPGLLDLHWCFVDVRDVARAHILLMETEDAKGRHLCTNTAITMTEVAKLLKENYPDYPIPCTNLVGSAGTLIIASSTPPPASVFLETQLPYKGNVIVKLASFFEEKGTGQYLRSHVGKAIQVDNSKLRNMGFTYIDAKQSVLGKKTESEYLVHPLLISVSILSIDTIADLLANGHIPEPKKKKLKNSKKEK